MRRPQAELEAAPTTLYRAFDDAGRLLYIGIAVNWASRWERHRQRSAWFDEVARLDLRTYPTRSSAALAEAAAIRAEKPVHNIEHTDRDTRPEQWRKRKANMADRLSSVEGNLNPDSLVGSFFHSGARPGWQGCVVAEPASSVYLVELFSWVHRGSTEQHLVPLQRMIDEGWIFYDESEWMNYQYEVTVADRWRLERAGDL